MTASSTEIVASAPPSVPVGPASFKALPGSDRLDELLHLLREPTRFFHDRFERHGRVFKSRLVIPAVFAIGEEANKSILITRKVDYSQGRGYARTPLRWVFEGSIMLQDGEEHRRTRAVLTPAVGRLAVHESAERVWEIWDRCAAGVTHGGSEDVYQLSERTTFDVAANVLAGLSLGPETDAFRSLFEDVIGGMMVQFPVRIPFGRLDRSLRARAALVRQLEPHVLRARAEDPPAGLVGQLAHHRDEDGEHLTVKAIVEHLVMLAWAGYDTTASAASWILHNLAQRPDWQERVRDELAAGGDDLATFESGARMPLLEAFLLECERMYPSVLFFPRVSERDVELHGLLVPKDMLVCYSPYMSHRDPGTFDNPNAFDPDRWLPGRGDRRPSTSSLFGFGGGMRVCLGKAFAKLQLRLMVRAMLRRHRLEPDPTARWTVMGLPVHHPVGSRIRFSPIGGTPPG